MSTFALEKWYQDSKCTIYSVRDDLDDVESFTEADRFFEKFGRSKDENLLYAAQLILQFLTNEICKINGANELFFNREEDRGSALPFRKKKRLSKIINIDFFYDNFPLRLFCYRISDEILVVFNGDLKTAQTVQDSKDLLMHFRNAQIYSKRIEDALRDRSIIIDNNELISEDSDEIIL
ncbi:hypothetical protein [Empedobacter falsenii]